MPYKSKAQAAYFNIHKKQLQKQGVDVDEWNRATKGKKIPKKASTTKTSGTRSSTTSNTKRGDTRKKKTKK